MNSKETDCTYHFLDADELWVWGEDKFLAQHKERCWNCGAEEAKELAPQPDKGKIR